MPRQEKPEYFSGGKVVHFERVEWVVEPDPATAAAALQTGEVDLVEFPLIDLLPTLRKARGCAVETFDPLGGWRSSRSITSIRRSIIPSCCRRCCPRSTRRNTSPPGSASRPISASTRSGFFTAGAPMANTVGLDAFTSRRDPAKAKKLLQEAGYKGEKVILMSPSDQPSLTAMCQVTRSIFEKIGINVDYQAWIGARWSHAAR